MHSWTMAVKAALAPLANQERAEQMQAYMRDQFVFYGIPSPQRRAALKALFAQPQLPDLGALPTVVRELWQQPQREYQLVAVDLLIKCKKPLSHIFLAEVEALITTKSWWDTVDLLASHIVAALSINHPDQTQDALQRWRRSDNLWLRRTTLLYQLKFKHLTDERLLFEIIRENQADEAFFIQKAIGWALREYSKTNAHAVESFIEQQRIQGLAQREGLKWLRNNARSAVTEPTRRDTR
ncbi:DNA alkylation repair protein [Vibrio ouci]|uniref:DNA alkylation repair protein n=1 Tax=Vibrio ouci TaxID=2499078 RepID=A0A4Y8WAK7_9VIBR|nr:DNA alkylation repair protein [Vibrio ouci]TFH89428.1 hypothetical protein ELS82_22330 [Vibrio ouci]